MADFNEIMEMIFGRKMSGQQQQSTDYSRVGEGWRGAEYASAEKAAAQTSEMREGFENRPGGGPAIMSMLGSLGGGRKPKPNSGTYWELQQERDRLQGVERQRQSSMANLPSPEMTAAAPKVPYKMRAQPLR